MKYRKHSYQINTLLKRCSKCSAELYDVLYLVDTPDRETELCGKTLHCIMCRYIDRRFVNPGSHRTVYYGY